MPRGEVLHLDEAHPEAGVRLVGAVEAHGIGIADAWKVGDLDSLDGAEEMFCKSFEGGEHIFLVHERHLAVDLCELRLAVRPEVLVAETFYDLEVTVETGDHQQLLEELGRLWQGLELALVHP